MNTSGAFRTFIGLGNPQLCLVLENSYPPKRRPRPHGQSLPIPVCSALPPRIHFLSVDLPDLDVSYPWAHTPRGLWCLASLTEHHVFRVRPRGSRCQSSVPFCGRVIVPCVDGPCSAYPFILRWTFGLSVRSGCCERCHYERTWHASVWMVFTHLGFLKSQKMPSQDSGDWSGIWLRLWESGPQNVPNCVGRS